ncbi:MAG: DegV family protein [Erysipelotrichaceae bacterium]|nr:DegV family protein [Erysipelotrichaceae bacterium]MBQ5444693.1 DegV family protein [Erysipelotrichaceae bacterium]MBQ6217891.1 DegV family protein [Erysipelotrichaceae bacterium]MBR6232700.1 DegV family protein [Erysipelotrichaceae bacterium]
MVIIATDSAADFEMNELQKMNVTYLPMSVMFGEDQYLENISISKEEFFERLKSDSHFPKTSQPSPAMFEELFENAKKNSDEVVYLPLSSGLSGDYQTAMSVKNMVGYEGIYVIDTLTCTGGQRLLVEKAVKMRDEGYTGAQIAEKMESLKEKTVIYTVMDTLEYLFKNGRLSNAAYYIAQLGHIKPIMHCAANSQGKAEIVSKHIGLNKAIRYIVDRLDDEVPDPEYPFYVMYTYDKVNAYKLVEKLKEKGIEVSEDRIIPVGATVGAHIGPYACAVAYIKK